MNRYFGDKFYLSSSEAFPMNVGDGADAIQWDTKTIWAKIGGVWTMIASGSGNGTSTVIQNALTGAGIAGYFAMFTGVSGLCDTAMISSGNSAYLLSGQFGIGIVPNLSLHVNGGEALSRQSLVTLSNGTQTVNINDSSYVQITSNSFDATTRSFQLGRGLAPGHLCIIEWAGTGSGRIPNHTGQSVKMQLAADWIPGTGDTLSLIYNGQDWLELARQVSSGTNTSTQNIQNAITGSGIVNYFAIFTGPSGITTGAIVNSGSSAYVNNPNCFFGIGGVPAIANHVFGGLATKRTTSTSAPSGVGTIGVQNTSYVKYFGLTNNATDSRFCPDIAGAVVGQRLLIEWGTGAGMIVNNSGVAGQTMRLNGDWIPGSGDTIELIWNGEGEWIEISRKVFSGINTSTQNIQNAITGSGTINTLALFSSRSGIADSPVKYNTASDFVSIGKKTSINSAASPGISLFVGGGFKASLSAANVPAGLSLVPTTDIYGIDFNGSISSGSNHQFFLGSGVYQQVFVLLWNSTGIGILKNAPFSTTGMGTVLNGDWIPGSGDTLSLICNGSQWLETARTVASGTNTSYQNITNALTGSGTTNNLAIWVSNSGLGNATSYESGSNLVVQNLFSTISGNTISAGANRIFTVDFNGPMRQSGYITGNVQFNSINKGAGKNVSVLLFASGTNTLTFNEAWTWMGNNPPGNILDQKKIIIALDCWATGFSDVYATWVAQT